MKNRKQFYKKDSIKTNTVENTYFRFQSWNTPRFQNVTKMTLFDYNKLLNLCLIKKVGLEKRYTKKQQKEIIKVGVMKGQISVMILHSKPKLNLNKDSIKKVK